MRLLFLCIVAAFFLALADPSQGAGTATLSVSATVLSKNTCKFNTTNAVMNFGTLDQLNPIDVTATALLDFRCSGNDMMVTYYIAQDYGLYETGPGGNRMKHGTAAAFLPYQLTVVNNTATVPRGVPPTTYTVTLLGKVSGADYGIATRGPYNDTVVVTITP